MQPTCVFIDLLAEKFKLFNGVFGASDEVLGASSSRVWTSKSASSVHLPTSAVRPEQIEFQFDQFQQELESQITQARSDASEQLLKQL